MEHLVLPPELISSIGTEKVDFAVKAKRAYPLIDSYLTTIWSIFIIFMTSSANTEFIGPLFKGEDVHFKKNGVAQVANINNLAPLAIPILISIAFTLIGFYLLLRGIYMLFKRGGYFIGTPTRLVHYSGGNIRSIDWEQFIGDIKVSGNAKNGTITLHLKTGNIVHRKNSTEKFVPDSLYISHIQNVYEIEKICRQRIKENDPTPSAEIK